MSLFNLVQIPEHLAGLMEQFIRAFRKQFVRLEHALAASACVVGSCSRTRTSGGKQSRGSFAVPGTRPAALLPDKSLSPLSGPAALWEGER